MKNAVKLFGFTILVVLFYAYVGQMVPQQRTYPPEELAISEDMDTQEMVRMGQRIVEGKGTCLTCHSMEEGGGTGRFPALGGIGARAGERQEGVSDLEYLAQSRYEPNAYVVEGYTPAMPPAAEPPIGLSDAEIKTVIAYLQSLGGTPTITMATELPYGGDGGGGAQPPPSGGAATASAGGSAETGSETAGSGAEGAAGGAAESPSETPGGTGQASESADASTATATADLDGPALFKKYQCQTCHSVESEQKMIGPSLHDVGSRLSREEIRTSILEPNETIAEGYQPQVMSATLEAAGFFDQVTDAEVKVLVDYLANQTGG